MICLEGLNQSDLNNVLDYIYHGELQIYQHDLERFLGIAERLKLEGLIGGNQQKDENDTKAENILEENVVKPDCTLLESTEENKRPKNVNRAAEKPVISVQSSDIHNLEELDQKVEESYSKDSNGFYACHYCEKSFKQRGHIKEHVETHFEGLAFPCSFCDAVLRSRNSLRFHNRQH